MDSDDLVEEHIYHIDYNVWNELECEGDSENKRKDCYLDLGGQIQQYFEIDYSDA
jgi:hypothetical protein